jgi:mono/diheme cytochrome c family protein
MDPHRDNPLLRFATFWWGLGAFLIFAVGLVLFWVFQNTNQATLDDVAAKSRYEMKAKVDAAQAEALSAAAIESAMKKIAGELPAAKPVPVERQDQVVPGSPTAEKLAAAPAVDTSAIDSAPASDAPIDPAVMELGKLKYMTCAACHGANGEGGPIGPPLAESDWVNGPISNLIRIQLRGLTGPITVSGKQYNFPLPMAALNHQTDEEIAAVLTYVRNHFGNNASAVTPDQVKALRGEVGKPMLTQEDLVKP